MTCTGITKIIRTTYPWIMVMWEGGNLARTSPHVDPGPSLTAHSGPSHLTSSALLSLLDREHKIWQKGKGVMAKA